MKKSELIAAVAKKADFSQKEVEAVIEAFYDVVVENCVEKGEEISFPLGKFKQKVNQAKTGTSPLTGKPMNVPESRSLSFKPSKTIKKIVEPAKKQSGKAKGKK